MNRGRIVEGGSPVELFDSPRTRFVADFLAEANVVAGRLVAVSGDDGDVEIAGHLVRVPRRGRAVGEVSVAIRPDAIGLHPADGHGLAGRVTRAAFVGRAVEYTIETAAGELLAIVPATDAARPAGADVRLMLDPRGVAIVA